MVEVVVGETYIGEVNNERIEVIEVQKDKYTGSESVLFKGLRTGCVFEYGLDAFKRCLLKREGVQK